MINQLLERDGIDTYYLGEAERVARSKITPIPRVPLYKHGFVRFGPNREILDGVRELYTPREGDVDDSIDRLKGVLDTGILSVEEARKLGCKISKNWLDPNNNKAVSVVWPSGSIGTAFHFAIEGFRPTDQVRMRLDTLYAVLIEKSPDFEVLQGGMHPIEVLIGNKVEKGMFRGMVLPECPDQLLHSDKILSPIASIESRVAEVVDLMFKSNLGQPGNCFPVYGWKVDDGLPNLYWPMVNWYK